MLDEVLAAGPETVGREFYDRMVATKEQGGTPLETRRRAGRLSRIGGERRHHGPAAQRRLGSVGGLGRLRAAISTDSDIYTLRRIVPKDRGFTWGDR